VANEYTEAPQVEKQPEELFFGSFSEAITLYTVCAIMDVPEKV